MSTIAHVGRFAPSPTGPLHFGSLVAALASHVAARAAGGRWLLRIDDIDPPREVPGASDAILGQLEAFGLGWDGPVVYQGRRTALYREALAALEHAGLAYACSCTRREIRAAGRTGPLGPVYPGHCRAGSPHPRADHAIRVRLPNGTLALDDAVQGHYRLDATRDIGDVILRRRDGLWAYHLATAVDDAALGVTHVVRGADLLPAALVQAALQPHLGPTALHWAHLPVVRWPGGDKLSKQTAAPALDTRDPVPVMLSAWSVLGQTPPDDRPATVVEFLAFAYRTWRQADVPRGPVPLPPGSRDPSM